MGCLMEKFMRKNSGSNVVNAASIEILELTDAELDAIAGGDALDGLDLLNRAMGGSIVINNLIRKFDIYYLRT
jgi:hypothetical protein